MPPGRHDARGWPPTEFAHAPTLGRSDGHPRAVRLCPTIDSGCTVHPPPAPQCVNEILSPTPDSLRPAGNEMRRKVARALHSGCWRRQPSGAVNGKHLRCSPGGIIDDWSYWYREDGMSEDRRRHMARTQPVRDWRSDFDVLDQSYVVNPFPRWDELRRVCPIASTDRRGAPGCRRRMGMSRRWRRTSSTSAPPTPVSSMQ